MNLFLTRIFQNNIPQSATLKPKEQNGYARVKQGVESDTFVKTSPTFKSNGSKTKAGDRLKELDNITCPYSGVKMISATKMSRVEHRLENYNTLSDGLDVLQPYKPCMQKLEKQVFGIFKDYANKHPNSSVNNCLAELKPECLAKLRIEEFKVLDNIDKLSNKMTPMKALEIRRITTNARRIILNDRSDQIFKRKDLLLDLSEATKNCKDKELADEIWDTANKLPKSSTNLNAFVVKYADRSQQEVLSRLLRPSVASIEHITPKSINPDHTLANFMLASRDWNSDRGNIPLKEYIKKHPAIYRNTQRYTDDIIKSIHKGKLKDCDWYPYMLKEKLYNESEGYLKIHLNNYKISKEDAFANASPEVIEKYNEIVEQNKLIEPIER